MSGRPRIESQLKSLRTLDREGLAVRYQQLYGKPFPRSVTRDLIEAAIGYQLQKRLVARLRHRLMQTLIAGEAVIAAVAADHEQIVLIRTWKGQCHTVTVLGDGSIEYAGEIHPSLDAVARHITGGQRSANQLFGPGSGDDSDPVPASGHGRR